MESRLLQDPTLAVPAIAFLGRLYLPIEDLVVSVTPVKTTRLKKSGIREGLRLKGRSVRLGDAEDFSEEAHGRGCGVARLWFAVRKRRALKREQVLLPSDAAGEAAKPVRRDDAMAWDDDARVVLPEGETDGARGARSPDRLRDF